MKHIVSFSTGLSSAICVERVLDRYGWDDVLIVFMDTLQEDSDNYRFMRDCQQRWPQIITLTEGRTPYQVSEDKQIIPNQKIAPCTFVLKIELFRWWLERFRDQQRRWPQVTVHLGYDYAEVHRCGPNAEAYRKLGWWVDFPLLWKPYENRRYVDVVRDDWASNRH